MGRVLNIFVWKSFKNDLNYFTANINSNGEASGGSRGLLLPLLLSGSGNGSGVGGNGGCTNNGVGSGNGDDEASCTTATGGQSDQSASEDSSLTDSDR